MACGGAQVRDARALVPVRQATVGTADVISAALRTSVEMGGNG